MTGLKPLTWLAMSRWAIVTGVLALAGCQSDGWRFGRQETLGAGATGVSPASTQDACGQNACATLSGASSTAAKPQIVRAQFTGEGGVSMPMWRRNRPPAPTYPVTDTYDSSSGSNYYPTTSYPTTTPSTYPSTGSSSSRSTNSSTSGVASSASSPTAAQPSAGASTGVQTVTPNPAYGSDMNSYPRVLPPLTGDAAGMGPYEPDYGPDAVVYPPMGLEPMQELPLDILAEETMTGRFMIGAGINSDAGLMASIMVDEQNFDWRNWPRSFEDIRAGRAWRGDGQRFHAEAMPGTEVHRYLVSFQEPYWFDSQVSFGCSAEYYTRIYESWNEERLGGRIALGYHFNYALTGSVAFRGMNVTLYDLVNPAPAELLEAKGHSGLYGFQASLAHDTRDSRFLATEGHLIELSIEQVIGTYKYPQANLDVRKYFLIRERPDGTGRHVLSLSGRFGWTDSDTPIYEHFFPGGFSTIRGFDFRGACPRDDATGVFVGGHTQLLASAEYLFPITADDMLRGVIFCDTGTAEPSLDEWTDNYRVAPGFGLRITVPAMGPAPIALDFAFPVSDEPGDRREVFSFWVGFLR